MRRWLERTSAPPDALRAYVTGREQRRAVIALLLDACGRLERLYAGNGAGIGAGAGSDADKRAGKVAVLAALADDYARLKASWGGYAGFDRLFASGVNNALLASVASYNALVPALREVLLRQDGDLAAFYREVRSLAALSRADRMQRLAGYPAAQASKRPPAAAGDVRRNEAADRAPR